MGKPPVADVTTGEVTILIVDDDADMRLLARHVLSSAGIIVAAEAHDGPAALAELDRLDPPPVPSVVLLDNQMPGPTGLEVAREILSRVPTQLIVLFSAYLDDAIIERAKAIGITACISKSQALDLGRIITGLTTMN
jgi:CheY-like chemotaxis protein